MRATWYGHSTWVVETNGTAIVIDPFFTGNPKSPVGPEAIDVDYIVVTHGHGDHLGDAPSIAARCDAEIISTAEVCAWLRNSKGMEKTHPLHIGGGFHFPFGYLKLTPAFHGSSLPDGTYGGMPAGLLLKTEGSTLYHAGDTGLFSDMALIGAEGVDLALLPIGDNYTMGPDDALKAVKFIKPKRVVPMHFETWELIAQDPQAFAERVSKETDSAVTVLEPGEWVEV